MAKDWKNESLHVDKTRQDRMPVNERPRVKAAEARRKAMQEAAQNKGERG